MRGLGPQPQSQCPMAHMAARVVRALGCPPPGGTAGLEVETAGQLPEDGGDAAVSPPRGPRSWSGTVLSPTGGR